MKIPQIKPDWETGIYIGNGVVAKPNNKIKIGTKMIGAWGAMEANSYGVITQIDLTKVFIAWDEFPGSVSYDISEINKGQMMLHGKPVGVGIYTEDQYYEGA